MQKKKKVWVKKERTANNAEAWELQEVWLVGWKLQPEALLGSIDRVYHEITDGTSCEAETTTGIICGTATETVWAGDHLPRPSAGSTTKGGIACEVIRDLQRTCSQRWCRRCRVARASHPAVAPSSALPPRRSLGSVAL